MIQQFVPHCFRPRVEALSGHECRRTIRVRIPTIYVPDRVLQRTSCYVDLAQTEVGWYGVVQQLPQHDFVIRQLFLVEQLVGPYTNALTSEGLDKLAMRLLPLGRRGELVLEHLRLWAHSHVNMPTSASRQDERQMEQFAKCQMPWCLRLICNKLGRLDFCFYDYEQKFRIVDVPWAPAPAVNNRILAQVQREFRRKVRVVDAAREDPGLVIPGRPQPRSGETELSAAAETVSKAEEEFWDDVPEEIFPEVKKAAPQGHISPCRLRLKWLPVWAWPF